MNRNNILIVTSHQSKNDSLKDWSGIAHPYHVNVVYGDEKAIEFCHLQQFDLVIVDITSTETDAKKLNAVLPILQENVTLLPHEGEPVEKLSANVEAVLNAKKYKRILNMILLEPADDVTFRLPNFSLN